MMTGVQPGDLEPQTRLVLDQFHRLNEENQKKFLEFMFLLVHSQGFAETFHALISSDSDALSWSDTMELVDAWMEKEDLGSTV